MALRSSFRTVDYSALPSGTVPISLEGICAQRGAVVGRLHIIEDPLRFDLVQPGEIVVTNFTNNSWEPSLAVVYGLITELGNLLSHPADVARKRAVPGLVASTGAIERLRCLDGEQVTLDSSRKQVYPGRMPIRQVEERLDLWAPSGELASVPEHGAGDNLVPEQSWERLKKLGNTLEDFEGRFRGAPKRPYGHFQLGYYIRGWQLSDATWTAILSCNSPIFHGTPAIKAGILYFRVCDEDHYWATLKSKVRWDHLERLVQAGRESFARGERFFAQLARIDSGNVRALVDILAELLSHMHIAFFRCRLIDHHAWRQLRYVHAEAQPTLYDLAVRRDHRLAQNRSIMREKAIDQDVLTATVVADSALLRLFQHQPPAELPALLAQRFPEFLDEVQKFQSQYKFGSEDLRQLSDLDVCLSHLRELVTANGAPSSERLVSYCADYVPGTGAATAQEIVQIIRDRAPRLHSLLQLHQRLSGRSVIELIGDAKRAVSDLDAQAAMLDHYPNLQQQASLARQSASLRDDAHELITRFQKQAAPLMLEIGMQAVHHNILKHDEDVFQLDPDEFVVLVEDMSQAGYVGRTIRRRIELETAEHELEANWLAQGPVAALRHYKTQVAPISACLAQQAAAAEAAGHTNTQGGYTAESARLAARQAELTRRAVCTDR